MSLSQIADCEGLQARTINAATIMPLAYRVKGISFCVSAFLSSRSNIRLSSRAPHLRTPRSIYPPNQIRMASAAWWVSGRSPELTATGAQQPSWRNPRFVPTGIHLASCPLSCLFWRCKIFSKYLQSSLPFRGNCVQCGFDLGCSCV